jgi:hypothetical protein
MAKKSTKKSTTKADPLCILYEADGVKAELFRDGESFRVNFPGTKRKDREFESLPALLSGLHGIFVEIRMSGQGVRGLDALGRVSDDARQDVLAASRKIHAAIEKAGA